MTPLVASSRSWWDFLRVEYLEIPPWSGWAPWCTWRTPCSPASQVTAALWLARSPANHRGRERRARSSQPLPAEADACLGDDRPTYLIQWKHADYSQVTLSPQTQLFSSCCSPVAIPTVQGWWGQPGQCCQLPHGRAGHHLPLRDNTGGISHLSSLQIWLPAVFCCCCCCIIWCIELIDRPVSHYFIESKCCNVRLKITSWLNFLLKRDGDFLLK